LIYSFVFILYIYSLYLFNCYFQFFILLLHFLLRPFFIVFELLPVWVAQLLNDIIVWMVLYCEHQLLGVKKKTEPVLHLSLGKASPFTLESHICVKALKRKVSQIIRCLIKPLLKNSIQTIFQRGIS